MSQQELAQSQNPNEGFKALASLRTGREQVAEEGEGSKVKTKASGIEIPYPDHREVGIMVAISLS